MKKLLATAALIGVLAASFLATSFAQTYPWSTPQYTPIAVLPVTTLSAPGAVVFTNSGSVVASLTVQGTCTGIGGSAKVSNDGVNYTTTYLYPINQTSASGVASIAATGAWRANIQGFRYFEFVASSVSAACNIGINGDEHTLQVY